MNDKIQYHRLAWIGVWSAAVFVTVPAVAQSENAANDQHATIAVERNEGKTNSLTSELQWYREAGLGMFLHWGISSVDGKQDLSWGMMANCPWNSKSHFSLTPEKYFQLADRFNPTSYDPEKWMKAAKDAGFGYAVLTTRHHDGYALWPSEYGDFSTRTHMGGRRDLIRPYVEACRKVGLKVGFYYSPPDWHFHRQYMSFTYGSKGTPESPHFGLKHEPVQLPEKPAGFADQYVAYVNGQITELMTRYGKIDVLWFDGGAGPKVLSQDQIREIQPGILINDRQHGKGDFSTKFECQLPEKRPEGCWEHCFSMVGAWGYTDGEVCGPTAHLLTHLVKCRAWGGNVLANFGPRPDGRLPGSVYRRLAEVQDWMNKHRESVVGVEPGPYPEQSNVPVTVRGKCWYLHLLPESDAGPAFAGPVLLTGVGKPRNVTMLGTNKNLDSQFADNRLTISVPQPLRTTLVDVIAVDW